MTDDAARHDILMPRLSDTMTEGTVGRWLKGPGDEISPGDGLVEIDTDKATTIVEAEVGGFLVKVLADEGASVAIGQVIAVIAPTPAGVASAGTSDSEIGSPNSGGVVLTQAAPTPPGRVRFNGDEDHVVAVRTRATPLARALARQAGLKLTALAPGSGPQGRILRHDVQRKLALRLESREQQDGHETPTRLTRIQELIARRMTSSKQEVPHYYLAAEADMTAAMLLLRELREIEDMPAVSLNGLVIRSCALALRDTPSVNASWADGGIVHHKPINVGIAVALDDEELIVPVIKDAAHKTVGQVSAESRELADRARQRLLRPDELEGGTFTISNLGMYGVDEFHAIINPPESGILAVGTVRERAAVCDGQITVRSTACLSLSADHRVYSGATAAMFLQRVVSRLVHPLQLCL